MRTTSTRLACTILVAALLPGGVTSADVTTPEEHLGRPVGGDFTLTDWDETSGYYWTLADQSPRVTTQRLGETTEGRDFLLTVISSGANLDDLEAIKGRARILADPRDASDEQQRDAIENGKVILFISPAMHATETAATQWAMEFAYDLATSDEAPYAAAREEVVVCLFPCTNPDGLDHVTGWYRQTVGTPYESSGLLKLYQYYAGHDNNRDWFMLTQNETRHVTEQLYTHWFPQVYWDVHQQGSTRERMFVPPFRDPLNPNLDPGIITGIDAIGSRALHDMTRDGLTGISTGVTYDMWWNGGNRNVPVRHNIIGLLTEAASVRLASPVFLTRRELRAPGDLGEYGPSNRFPAPWPGGWWRIRDIIDYEHSFGRSLLGSLSREPELWRRTTLEAAERTIAKGRGEGPRGWIIPSDARNPHAVARLVDVLLLGGVELHVSDDAFMADGRLYPAGSIVVRRDQPYGTHAKDLLEVQRYPDGNPPYDVSGWTLPLLLGVRRVEVMQPLDLPLTAVGTVDAATAAFAGDTRLEPIDGRALSLRHGRTWTRLARDLQGGLPYHLVTRGERAGLLLGGDRDDDDDDARGAVELEPMRRIGLYSTWSGSMDEGWLRYMFDTYEIPYVSVKNETLRAGALREHFDALVIADIGARQLDEGRAFGSVPEQFTRGLSPEGAAAIEAFVRGGGMLVTIDASSQWAIELFQLPLVDVTREETNREFSCPGSVLRAMAETSPLTTDLPASVGLMFSRSAAWRRMSESEREAAGLPARRNPAALQTLLRYAPTRVLLSGYIDEPEVIEGRAAWVRAEHGEGVVHLFAFRPQYRGWTHGPIELLFRAPMLDR